MPGSIAFGGRSTADQVLAGIDLTGKRIVVTGCNSGIGFETMCALSANGAQVIGLARSLEDAASACRKAGSSATPVACDLADLDSIAEAAATVRGLHVALDAIVANAAVANLPTLQTRYGLEMQFLVNHIGHFALVNQLQDEVRSGSGRIVIVSSAVMLRAPGEGILFDNLDGRRFYDPSLFHAQSKLANALFAAELSRRLSSRGISVNSVHPGITRGTGLHRNARRPARLLLWAAQWFMKSAQQGAATQTLLAASPLISGITGEFWSNCRIAAAHPLLKDADLAKRLWDVSADIVARHTVAPSGNPLQEAA